MVISGSRLRIDIVNAGFRSLGLQIWRGCYLNQMTLSSRYISSSISPSDLSSSHSPHPVMPQYVSIPSSPWWSSLHILTDSVQNIPPCRELIVEAEYLNANPLNRLIRSESHRHIVSLHFQISGLLPDCGDYTARAREDPGSIPESCSNKSSPPPSPYSTSAQDP